MALAYYNEFNPEAAAMLEQLMIDCLIAPGDIDTRSITEVSPDDLKPFTQCHFFAGIGGWSLALRAAGWPDDKPVWTGSAPCQPFSSAGRQKGKEDERHLFPCWLGLIRELGPATIFGEQVASAVAHGWLDDVYSGLEAEGYAVGAAVLPACSVGAPHRRDRLWFVANRHNAGQPPAGRIGQAGNDAGRRGAGYVAHAAEQGLEGATGSGLRGRGPRLAECGDVVNPQQQGLEGQPRHDGGAGGRQVPQRPASAAGFWDNGVWLDCPDQKRRLIEPSIPLLAHGLPSRKPILHALGNAIVPQVAAEFIKASGA